MSHQNRVIKVDNSYGKTALCEDAQQLDAHCGRRVPWPIVEAVLLHSATVNWQGIKLQAVLDPPSTIKDTPEYQREQVALEAKRQLLQE